MLLKELCCFVKRLKGTGGEQSAMLRSNTDGSLVGDEVRLKREGFKRSSLLSNEHFRTPIEKNRTPSTSLKQPVTMVKKEKGKLKYYEARIGFRGEAKAAAASYKGLMAISAMYPEWSWRVSTKEVFDSMADKAQQLHG